MKLPHVLFAILLAMCGVVVATFVVGETPFEDITSVESGETSRAYLGHGIQHDRFTTMLSGGPGADRHERILWLGWAFAMLQVILFVCLLAYGGQKQGRLGPLKIPLLVGGIVYAAIFTAMFYTYQGYMLEPSHAMFLSLPIPTAWMIYGVWPIPLVFMLLYMFTFDSWTFRDEDMKRFQQILAEKQADAGDQT